MNNHTMLLDIHHNTSVGQGRADDKHHTVTVSATFYLLKIKTDHVSDSSQVGGCEPWGCAILHLHRIPPGELPPPPPSACFGRDELIEKIIGHAKNFKPVALIGAGGICKNNMGPRALHHKR